VLAPVFANISMEWFEEKALKTCKEKPKTWFRYVNNTLYNDNTAKINWKNSYNTLTA